MIPPASALATDGDFPAHVVIKARDFPGNDSREGQVIVQGEPLVIVGSKLIDQTLFESRGVLSVRRNAAVARRRAVEDFRSAVGDSGLVVFGVPRDSIARRVTECHDHTGRDVAKCSGFAGKITAGHHVPGLRQIGTGGRCGTGCRLRLVREKLVRADRGTSDDSAADRQCGRVGQEGGILKVTLKLRRRGPTVGRGDGFAQGRAVGRADSLDFAQRFGPGCRSVLLDMVKLPEVAGIDQRQQPESITGGHPGGRDRPRCQSEQIAGDPVGSPRHRRAAARDDRSRNNLA